MKLEGKVAIITGSSTNIGKATALLFAKEGAKVVVNSKNSVDEGKKTVEEIRAEGGEAVYVQADLSQASGVEKLFSETTAEFGRLDILVNNAGVANGMPFAETTKEYWVEAFDNNFFNMVLCSQAAAKHMEVNGGVILNTTSIRGLGHTGRE